MVLGSTSCNVMLVEAGIWLPFVHLDGYQSMASRIVPSFQCLSHQLKWLSNVHNFFIRICIELLHESGCWLTEQPSGCVLSVCSPSLRRLSSLFLEKVFNVALIYPGLEVKSSSRSTSTRNSALDLFCIGLCFYHRSDTV